MVINYYGRSIYDLLCSHRRAKFCGSHIQANARPFIRSTCLLHVLGIIHTDLKPENILLSEESFNESQLLTKRVYTFSTGRKLASKNGKRKILKTPEIKIIDIDGVIFVNKYHLPVIFTRHYSAPAIGIWLGQPLCYLASCIYPN